MCQLMFDFGKCCTAAKGGNGCSCNKGGSEDWDEIPCLAACVVPATLMCQGALESPCVCEGIPSCAGPCGDFWGCMCCCWCNETAAPASIDPLGCCTCHGCCVIKGCTTSSCVTCCHSTWNCCHLCNTPALATKCFTYWLYGCAVVPGCCVAVSLLAILTRRSRKKDDGDSGHPYEQSHEGEGGTGFTPVATAVSHESTATGTVVSHQPGRTR